MKTTPFYSAPHHLRVRRPIPLLLPILLLIPAACGLLNAADSAPPLPPIQSVTIGPNREFLVNGKPFLPIGGWLQQSDIAAPMKEIGINTMCGYWRNEQGAGELGSADKYAEAVWKSGLYFVPTFESKHPDEMARMKGAPYLLSWLHGDEPDLPNKKSDAVFTCKLNINPSRPLNLLTDGNPKTSAVLAPMAGAEVTIRYPKPATVTRLALGNGTDGLKASEVAVVVDGKEICRGTLPDTVDMKSFDLPAPVTLQELTLKILAIHEMPAGQPPPNWGTFAGVDGFDASGANVLRCEVRLVPQQDPMDTLKTYKEIKAFDPTRPVWVTFSSMFLEDFYDSSWFTTAQARALYPQYVTASDVFGIDIYPIYGWNQPQNIQWVSKATQKQRELVGPGKPVYQWIETTPGNFGSNSKPVTGMEIRNEVYQALASGCTAIGYFTHTFQPKFSSFSPSEENKKALKELNAEITRLAPSLLGADAPVQPAMTLEGGLPSLCHAKETAGEFTVIAINLDGKKRGGQGTITWPGLKAGTVITVQGEDRTFKSEEGKWTDSFEPLAVHVYQFK